MLNVTLTRYASGDAFLEAAQHWLMRAEAENNLILGIAAGLSSAASQLKEPPYFVTASTEDGVAGCAVRSPPYPLAIARCAHSIALDLLHRHACSRPHL